MNDSEYHDDWQFPEFLVLVLGVVLYFLCCWKAVTSDCEALPSGNQNMPEGIK